MFYLSIYRIHPEALKPQEKLPGEPTTEVDMEEHEDDPRSSPQLRYGLMKVWSVVMQLVARILHTVILDIFTFLQMHRDKSLYLCTFLVLRAGSWPRLQQTRWRWKRK